MKQEELLNLTAQELAQEATKCKKLLDTFNVLIAIMFGVALYTTVKKGFGFFSFFPLFFLPLAASMWINYKAVKKEMENRKIN
jgi:hypothetical protein